MSDSYTCKYCKRADETVLEWTVWHTSWQGKQPVVKFYAHMNCHLKEMSTSGDGHGERITA